MKEEIKEILEDIKRHLDYVEATKQSSIRDNEMKAMYDYITNLQEENERLHIQLEDRAYEQIKFLYKDYKSRIDKAIKFTNQFINYKTSSIDEWENVELVLETIVQLLEGEDKEWN